MCFHIVRKKRKVCVKVRSITDNKILLVPSVIVRVRIVTFAILCPL